MTETKARYTLTAHETKDLPARVLAILRDCRCRNARITGAELAQTLGYKNDRKVRLVIRDLIEQGHPIMSSVHPPYGYCLATTEEEAAICEATLRKRAIEILSRLRDFRRSVACTFGPVHQMPLFVIEQTIKELNR